MIQGFYYKLVVLFFIMCGIYVLILLVAILPSYFLSSVKRNIVSSKLELQKGEPVLLPDQKTLLVIKDLDRKLSLTETAGNNKFLVSEKVINSIVDRKMSDIKITDISYENDPSKAKEGSTGKTISIKGIAPSRERLLLFRQRLEDGASFKRVDLPISNFVKGSNIQFYLNLILE